MSSAVDDDADSPLPSQVVINEATDALHSSRRDQTVDEDEHPYDSDASSLGDEDGEGFRENRFQRSVESWQYHTRDERGLAASLDQSQSNDLSIHLYNAHMLKRDARDSSSIPVAQSKSHPTGSVKRGEDGRGSWRPGAVWTAWPLMPEHVPGQGEIFGGLVDRYIESDSSLKSDLRNDGKQLEDEICALILRHTKEDIRQQRRMQSLHNNFEDAAQNLQPLISTDYVQSDSPSDRDTSEQDSNDNPTQQKFRKLSPFLRDPAYLLDDDEAAERFAYPIKWIRAQVDGVLAGVHKLDRTRTPSRSKSRSSSTARASQRIQQRSCEDWNSPENDTLLTKGENAHWKSQRSTRARLPGQKDYGDVLHAALLAGCDVEVVQRTAKRCASLFGESDKTKILSSKQHDKGLLSDANILPGQVERVCPFESCPRHNLAYELPWRWREHLKRAHGMSREEIKGLERQLY